MSVTWIQDIQVCVFKVNFWGIFPIFSPYTNVLYKKGYNIFNYIAYLQGVCFEYNIL